MGKYKMTPRHAYRTSPYLPKKEARQLDRDLTKEPTTFEDRRACIEHLQDIHREHGYDKRWPTYDVGHEPAVYQPRLAGFAYSLTGSAAAACAE